MLYPVLHITVRMATPPSACMHLINERSEQAGRPQEAHPSRRQAPRCPGGSAGQGHVGVRTDVAGLSSLMSLLQPSAPALLSGHL